jgi:hypothetical protein
MYFVLLMERPEIQIAYAINKNLGQNFGEATGNENPDKLT